MDVVSLLIDRTDTQEKLITVVAVRFNVGSSRRQHSRAGGAGSDEMFEPLESVSVCSEILCVAHLG